MAARASSRRLLHVGWRCGLVAVAVLLSLAGCGGSRPREIAPLRPARPDGFRMLVLPAAGVSLSVPRNWTTTRRRGPLLASITSGSAIVTLWRHPTKQPPPADRRQLELYRAALEHAAQSRAGLERMIGATLERVDRQPAVVLDALERVAGASWRVRSVHIYAPSEELVLEERAPPKLFAAAERAAFARILASLRVAPPRSSPGSSTTGTSSLPASTSTSG